MCKKETEKRNELTHLNQNGEAIMVDVGEKKITERTAKAFAKLTMQPETLDRLLSSELKKGDGLAAARIAGIMAAKRTFELIPLCHNIPIESVEINFDNNGRDELYIYSFAKCSYKTGIEMEALTAVSVAALTVYDMCKAIDRGMKIADIHLLEKTGGKSDYRI
ncbi:MAG: cyclic pyranopterin monophosphate synthase MoaC [Oscillospiraceae bacterium]|nr:cyclic pyranopterin monophosphate synthase MoaC [Oscillospiraceae bacterium]